MRKTFATSKSKAEIQSTLGELEQICHGAWKENTIFPIVIEGTTLYTVSFRHPKDTKWELNLDVHGEISVRRQITHADCLRICAHIIATATISFVLLYGGISIQKIGFLAVLLLIEYIVNYGFVVALPYTHIKKFVETYLGAAKR